MKVNRAGLALIRKFEGLRRTAYRDAVGVWTIGYGHTSRAGPPRVVRGMKLSRQEAENLLAKDVEKFARKIRPMIKMPLNSNQFSALVSFAYNVGPSAFARSSVLRAINNTRFDQVPQKLSLWVKAGGSTLKELVRRRAAEAELFMSDQTADARVPDRSPEPVPGKPAHKSITNLAAILSAIAGLVSAISAAVRETSSLYVFVVLGLLIIASCLWIIRERWKKSTTEGV